MLKIRRGITEVVVISLLLLVIILSILSGRVYADVESGDRDEAETSIDVQINYMRNLILKYDQVGELSKTYEETLTGVAEEVQGDYDEKVRKEELRKEKIRKEKAAKEAKRKKEEARKLAEDQRLADERNKALELQRSTSKDVSSVEVKRDVSRGISAGSGGNQLNVRITAYTANCDGCSGYTATGVDVRSSTRYNGMCVIAVDPSVIPLHSKVEVNGDTCIALDTGGAIKGNKVDILVGSKEEARRVGVGSTTINVLGK